MFSFSVCMQSCSTQIYLFFFFSQHTYTQTHLDTMQLSDGYFWTVPFEASHTMCFSLWKWALSLQPAFHWSGRSLQQRDSLLFFSCKTQTIWQQEKKTFISFYFYWDFRYNWNIPKKDTFYFSLLHCDISTPQSIRDCKWTWHEEEKKKLNDWVTQKFPQWSQK